MKITDTLDQLLRLLLTSDEEGQVNEEVSPAPESKLRNQADEHGPERALPEWVRRANERVLAADSASKAASQSAPDALSADDAEQPDVKAEVQAVPESELRWAHMPEADPQPVAVEVPIVESEVAMAVEPEPIVVEAPDPIEEPVALEAEPGPLLGAAAAAAPEPEPRASLVADPAPAEVEVLAADLDHIRDPGSALVPIDHDLAHLEIAARVAESLNLGFHLGSAIERIASAAKQGSEGVPALREAAWLIERYIAILERRPIGADLHLSAARLARSGDVIAGLKALAEALDADAAPLEAEQTVEPERSAVAVADVAVAADGADPEPDLWSSGRIQRLSSDPSA